MRRTIKLTALFTAGLALALAGLAPTAVAARLIGDNRTTIGGFRPAVIDWQPCPERPTDTTVQCATLQLPIDWSQPNGPTFGLVIAKQAAADPTPDYGPLVINPGGPGGSGVDFALRAKQFFAADLLRHFDIIGFDPRGTNRSAPVLCSTGLLNLGPFPVPSSEADYAALLAYNTTLEANCRANTGPIFDHVDTTSVDRDIDAIRAALGEPKISYYGVSYGTLIGQGYAELFPDRIRAMVIDSNMDHSLSTQPFLLTEAATAQDSFDQFVSWCDQETTCALHGQDVRAIWAELMRKADAGTLVVPGTNRKLTWFDLSQFALGALYGPRWSQLATTIANLYTSSGGVALPTAAPAGALAPYPFPVFCEDWSLPVSGYQQLRQYFAESKAIAPDMRTSPLGWFGITACLGWTGPVNDPQHRLRVHTDVPLLELNAVHDPSTPYLWALDAAAQLGRNGRLVTYLGWGHGTYPRSSCTIGIVNDYLLNGTLPVVGASCPAVPPSAAQSNLLAPNEWPDFPGWRF